MTGTKSLTTKLQKYNSLLNLPCSDSQIEILKDKLGVNFTDDVIELYKHHDGMQPSQIFPFRFMSISEVVETEINFTDWLNDSKTDVSGDNKLSLFWTDDNSNYAGFCLSEKLKGMICIINHDEIDLTPVFKDVFSFYESLLKVAEQNSHLIENDSDDCLIDWNEMETDFPRLFSSKIHDEDDSELANHFIELFNSEPNDQKKSHFAFCAMNVIPFDQTEKIYAFSESENM